MSGSLAASRDFLALSRRFLDVLGPDGLGSESDQRQFAVDGVEPIWVALPATLGEVEQTLRICAEHDLAVVPAGAGLRLAQGMPAERLDVVLSSARLDAIVDHAAADLTLTAQAGVTLAAAQSALAPAGQWLPFDPPVLAETTIGGLIAAQASGPVRQAFGTARESLLGVRAFLADGTLVKSGGRVVKNVAGYDLQKLLVGSFGTLAVIVEATFKVQPRAEAHRVVCCSGPLAALTAAAAALADSVLGPRFLEILADDGRPPLLVAGFAGLSEEAESAADRARTIAAGRGAAEARAPIDEPGMHASIESLQRPADDAVVLRAGMRRDGLAPWLESALERCRPAAERVRVHAHAGIGVVRLRLDGTRVERFAEALRVLRETAARSGGYVVVESAPPGSKGSIDVWGPPRGAFALMRGVKAAFDPSRRLSPGRFVGGL